MGSKYLDLEGLKRLIEDVKGLFSVKNHKHVTSEITGLNDLLDNYVEKNTYAGINNFPSAGKPGNIYIDTLTNKIYRWDDNATKYYCVGSDYSEIDLILCGDANS